MLKWIFIAGFLLWSTLSMTQTPSGIGYPMAECNGGTCPAYTAVKSHITATFLDTLTETFYVAGQFRTLGGQTRIGLGAMNAATGALLSFAPVVDTFGCIYAISIKGDTLFVGGRFTSINGTPRTNFAAIRISTGQLLPSFNGGIGGAADTVFAITVYNGRIYVGGKFTAVFSNSRTNIARLNYNGTINSWNPTGMGVVKKTMQWRNGLLAIARAPALEDRLVKIDTAATAGGTQLMITTGSSPTGAQTFQDFVTRNDSVYVVGSFSQVDGVTYQAFVVCNINNGIKRTWGINIPLYDWGNPKHKINIEYYRDSLYIGVADASIQDSLYHRIYVAHYRGSSLRTLKVYNSNINGLTGKFCDNLIIGNARLMEVERFAQHTSFPFGSMNCKVFSWCLKIPNLCGFWVGSPYSICPIDTIWVSVTHQFYYSSYVWNISFGDMTLIPNGDSCMVVTASNFTGGQITVRGETSCGIQNSSQRTIFITGLPAPTVSAGADDSLSCIVPSVVLNGTCSPVPISWTWTGPNAFSNADSVYVDTPGTFYLECVAPNGCRKRDSAIVFADTIPPTIVPFGQLPQITCAQPSVILDASSVYPSDSLRWVIGASSFSNPATNANPGNVFLVVTDRRNGCSSTDTLLVTQNMVLPIVSAVYTDTFLTCTIDSILLSGSSGNPNVIFHWEDTSSAQFADPFYVTSAGVYGLFSTDTSNGCAGAVIPVVIGTWYTQPSLVVASDSFNINCSYDSVYLVGSSLTTSAILSWTDSLSFNSGNPALTGQQGWYYVIATDTLNGCRTVDSAYVGYEPTLDVVASADTIICPGSGAVLNVVPVGGTPSFAYSWNNSGGNTALVTVYPADTLNYIVTVNDAAGCTGYDTVIINVPDPILDSTLSFQPCDPLQPTGQVQIYPWGGIPPYQYSIDNGMTWQSVSVFGSLNYGSYQFIIRDAIGCTHNTIAVIDTNSLSPAPEFLVSTSPELGDTVVVVDISNPRPDSVVWDFPTGTTIVDTSMFSPAIIPADTGAFYITMHAWYGTCEVVITRLINVEPFDSLNAQPWNANQIDSLILYPNPNNGVFTVHTELGGKQNFVILVTDELGIEQTRVQVSDADEWTGTISVSNPTPGNYVLRVIAEYDSAAIPFVIAQ